MKINLEKFYSNVEVQKIAKIKSRQYIAKYVENGHLMAIITGKGNGKRYMIKGVWLQDFISKQKNGLDNGNKYSKEEIKSLLQKEINKL